MIIGLLIIVSFSSLSYGIYQKQRADKQEAIAIENIKIANEQKILAKQAAKEAELARKMALINEHRAME
jgi:hypothetical protein